MSCGLNLKVYTHSSGLEDGGEDGRFAVSFLDMCDFLEMPQIVGSALVFFHI